MSRTDSYISLLAKYGNILFSKTLAKEDMLSLYRATKLLKSSDILYSHITKYISEGSAAKLIFLTLNLAMFAYQYTYASWFLYLTTTLSGLNLLYRIIFTNPLLFVTYFLSFYLRLLGESDKSKFNKVATFFNLPSYDEMAQALQTKEKVQEVVNNIINSKFIQNIVNHIPEGSFLNREQISDLLTKILLEQGIATYFADISQTAESVSNKMGKLFETLIKILFKYQEKIKKDVKVEIPAFYTDRTLDTQLMYDKLLDEIDDIKQKLKKVPKKKKKRIQAMIEKAVKERVESFEEKELKGKPCLDECKERAKTSLGCRCSSSCDVSVVGGKTWCWVDPKTCKKGKKLNKYLGYAYDYCDKNKTSKNCFTGVKYERCETKS